MEFEVIGGNADQAPALAVVDGARPAGDVFSRRSNWRGRWPSEGVRRIVKVGQGPPCSAATISKLHNEGGAIGAANDIQGDVHIAGEHGVREGAAGCLPDRPPAGPVRRNAGSKIGDAHSEEARNCGDREPVKVAGVLDGNVRLVLHQG